VSLRDSLPDSPEDSLVTVLVQLSEGALRRLRLGAGYGTVDCFRTQSSWTLHNFMGDAQTLELDGRLSRIGAGSPTSAGFEENVCPGLRSEDPRFLRLNYRFTATFRERFLFDRRTSATLAVSAERRSELTAYLREAYGGELSVTRQTPVRIPVTVSYSAFIDRTSADPATFCTFLDVCDLASTDIFTEFRLRSMVSLGLVRDRTDSPLDATRGSLLRVDLRHASTVLGSDTLRQFTKGVVDLAAHYRVGRGSVFSWRVRLGGVTSPRLQLTGERPRFVPPEERFYAGGATTVRGFSQNELGPLVRVVQIDSNGTVVRLRDRQGQVFDSLIGRLRTSPTGGDALLIGNAEYRFPIGRRLSGALFVDAGQVLQRDGGDGGSDLRITPGVGLRLASPIGPIRLDIGFNPYPPQSGPLFAVEPGGTELVRVTDPAGVPVSFAPERGFLGRLRVHFSVGQPF
jgi:outer membrane protein assembly factor BamA